MAKTGSVDRYRDGLVAWYRRNARDLPWRRDPTPWRVWVSEIMLQQTRVDTAIPYFLRFLERFPDPDSLAASSEEEVLEQWSGLGYYRRARLLRAGAREGVARHGGRIPRGEREVLSLPGVGRYTAGAIRSIAFGERAPIVDGNVTRVLARVFGVDGEVGRAPTSRRLWELAAGVVAAGEPGEVNQAQMELGALVCSPIAPRCGDCPLAAQCVARRDSRIDELPRLPPRRETVEVRRAVLLVRDGRSRVLLRRRKDDELLPGLWDLPGAFTGAGGDVDGDLAAALALLPFTAEPREELGRVRHAITYRRIALSVIAASAGDTDGGTGPGPDGAELAWREPSRALTMALSSPARKILARWAAPAEARGHCA